MQQHLSWASTLNIAPAPNQHKNKQHANVILFIPSCQTLTVWHFHSRSPTHQGVTQTEAESRDEPQDPSTPSHVSRNQPQSCTYACTHAHDGPLHGRPKCHPPAHPRKKKKSDV